MRKKLFIIVGIVILIFLFTVGIFIASLFSKQPTQTTASPSPTQNPYTPPLGQPNNTNPQSSLSVTNVFPDDKSTGAVADENVLITFNRAISPTEVSFSLSPSVPFTTSVSNNILAVTFTKTLQLGTTYIYTVSSSQNNFSQSYSFTTAAANDPVYQDSAGQQNAEWSKQNEPDLYIYNLSPYDTSDFSLRGYPSGASDNHFSFTVILRGTDTDHAKQAFISWLTSQGLTNDQISNLDIQYQ